MTYPFSKWDRLGSQAPREQAQTLAMQNNRRMDFRPCSYEEKTSV